jgi:hypothetical protein
MHSVESQEKLRRDILLLSLVSKEKPSKKPATKQVTSRTTFVLVLLRLFLYPEDGGDMFLEKSVDSERSICRHIP